MSGRKSLPISWKGNVATQRAFTVPTEKVRTSGTSKSRPQLINPVFTLQCTHPHSHCAQAVFLLLPYLAIQIDEEFGTRVVRKFEVESGFHSADRVLCGEPT